MYHDATDLVVISPSASGEEGTQDVVLSAGLLTWPFFWSA